MNKNAVPKNHFENAEIYQPFDSLKKEVFEGILAQRLGQKNPLNVVEFGSGIGTNRRLLKGSRDKWTEVEIDEASSWESKRIDSDAHFEVGDAIEYLSRQAAGSVDLVCGFNSIDQFDVERSINLLRAAHGALRTGGMFMHTVDQGQAHTLAYSYIEGSVDENQEAARWLCEAKPTGRFCKGILAGEAAKILEMDKEFGNLMIGNLDEEAGTFVPIDLQGGIICNDVMDKIISKAEEVDIPIIDHNEVQMHALHNLAVSVFGGDPETVKAVKTMNGPSFGRTSEANPNKAPVIIGGATNMSTDIPRLKLINRITRAVRLLVPSFQARYYSATVSTAVKN